MNREIKFRAWDGKYKKMHYKVSVGNTYDKENYTAHAMYLNSGDTDYHIPDGGQWMHFDEHSDCQLMQFIGLLDKHGKEIYEGDIVKSKSHNPENYLIEFIEGGFCATNRIVDNYPIDINHFYPSVGTDLEIIGNIYEHPELLTTK